MSKIDSDDQMQLSLSKSGKESQGKAPRKSQRWGNLLREFPQVESIMPVEQKTSVKKATSMTLRAESGKPGAKTSPPISTERTFEPPPPAKSQEPPAVEEETQEKIYRVSDINRAIKQQLESQFQFIWLQGEISNFKAHSASGHYYFSLKDEKTQISAVMFRGFNNRLQFTPESGMEVIVRGKITVYEPRGQYQFFCEHMEPVGAGALQKAFEQLKAKLKTEGLFDQQFKKAIPENPQRVGVVTSPTGAAIRDILNVLARRSPRVRVTVIPARVQGQVAASEVVRGIEMANQIADYDVLIVGRGGGSIEDLWCFNEEVVARAIFASKIPVISAVGHEIDYTISDMVADLRAPTPSAAAEVVAQSEEQLIERLQFSRKALHSLVTQKIQQEKSRLKLLEKALVDPRQYLVECAQRCDELLLRINQSIKNRIRNKKLQVKALENKLPSPVSVLKNSSLQLSHLKNRMDKSILQNLEQASATRKRLSGLLDSLSPLRVVERGFSIVKHQGNIVRSVKDVKPTDQVSIQLKDGSIDAEVCKK